MKQKLKAILKKLPVAKTVFRRVDELKEQIYALEADKHQLSDENIRMRLKQKKANGEPTHVVFVCHRPAIWSSLKSVCEACLADKDFQVTIVAVPNKKQLPDLGLSHENYESEGAEAFFAQQYDCAVNGYDYETGTWLDLASLKPDFLFFQSPYNICRPPEYHSRVVSNYCTLCYVHYGMPFMGGTIADETTPPDFFRDVHCHFAEFPQMIGYYTNRAKEFFYPPSYQVILSGYPKLDNTGEKKTATGQWRYQGEDKKFRILWTPRWNTGEGNCTFFDYKDKLIALAEENDNIELFFRPHPQAFSEYVARGQMTQQEVEDYIHRFEACPNASIDRSGDYLDNFYSADLLISDESSIIPEFYLTGRPIVMTSPKVHYNAFAKAIAEGFYTAKSWEQLHSVISQLLAGEDEMGAVRAEKIKNEFYLPESGAGNMIKDYLKNNWV